MDELVSAIHENPDYQAQQEQALKLAALEAKAIFNENGYLTTPAAKSMFSTVRNKLEENGLLQIFSDDNNNFAREEFIRQEIRALQEQGDIYIDDAYLPEVENRVIKNIERNIKRTANQHKEEYMVRDQVLENTPQRKYFPKFAMFTATFLLLASIACGLGGKGGEGKEQKAPATPDFGDIPSQTVQAFDPNDFLSESFANLKMDGSPTGASSLTANDQVSTDVKSAIRPEEMRDDIKPPSPHRNAQQTTGVQTRENRTPDQEEREYPQTPLSVLDSKSQDSTEDGSHDTKPAEEEFNLDLENYVDYNPENNRVIHLNSPHSGVDFEVDPDMFGVSSLAEAIIKFNNLPGDKKSELIVNYQNKTGITNISGLTVDDERLNFDNVTITWGNIKWDSDVFKKFGDLNEATLHSSYIPGSIIYLPVDLTHLLFTEDDGIDRLGYAIKIDPNNSEYFLPNMTFQDLLNATTTIPFEDLRIMLVDSNGNPLHEDAKPHTSRYSLENFWGDFLKYPAKTAITVNPEAFNVMFPEDQEARDVLRDNYQPEATITINGVELIPAKVAQFTEQETPISAGALIIAASQMNEDQAQLYAINTGQSVTDVAGVVSSLPTSYDEVYGDAATITAENPEAFGNHEDNFSTTMSLEEQINNTSATVDVYIDPQGRYWLTGPNGNTESLSDVIRYLDRSKFEVGDQVDLVIDDQIYTVTLANSTVIDMLSKAGAPTNRQAQYAFWLQYPDLFPGTDLIIAK